MPRQIERCRCGHAVCKDWHVYPEAALQGVKFTEAEARQVGHLLDKMDVEAQRPRIDTTDLLDRITKELGDAQVRYGKAFVPQSYIIPVRCDLLSAAYVEVEKSRLLLAGYVAKERAEEEGKS